MFLIQHCFICRPAEVAGIEPGTVATSALPIRRSNPSIYVASLKTEYLCASTIQSQHPLPFQQNHDFTDNFRNFLRRLDFAWLSTLKNYRAALIYSEVRNSEIITLHWLLTWRFCRCNSFWNLPETRNALGPRARGEKRSPEDSHPAENCMWLIPWLLVLDINFKLFFLPVSKNRIYTKQFDPRQWNGSLVHYWPSKKNPQLATFAESPQL